MRPHLYSSSPPWIGLLEALDRWRWVCFAAIAALYLAGLNGQWRITSDSAVYVQQARDIVSGQPTPWLADIGSTPPGLPWLIAAVGRGGDAMAGAGWGTAVMMLAMAGVVLTLTYHLFCEHADRPAAVLMVVLLAGNRLFFEMSFNLLTELPFAVGLLLLLWGHERRLKRKGGVALSLAMMAVGVMWMASFRSVAAVVVGAYVLAEVIGVIARRDQRRLGLAIVGLAVAAGILLWGLSTAVREDAAIFARSLSELSGKQLWLNAQMLMGDALPEAVFGQDAPWYVAWPLSLSVVAAGLALVRARLLWGVLFAVLLLQWVVFLSDARYVLPVLPVLVYGGWRLMVGAFKSWSPRWRNLGFAVVVLGVGGSNAIGVGDVLREQRSGDFYAAYRGGRYLPAVELAEVIRRETREGARIVGAMPWTLELAVLAERALDVEGAPRSTQLVWVGPGGQVRAGNDENPWLGHWTNRRKGERWEVRELSVGFE